MEPVRVLVVDDAATVRRLLSDVLGAEPGLRVVGALPDGRAALERIAQDPPDVIVLDVEMPEMDGLALLGELRRRRLRVPVVLYSSHTRRGAEATLDALALGATDYVTKPAAGSFAAACEHVRRELVPRLLGLSRRGPSRDLRLPVPAAAPTAERIEVVAFGASTGGPNALAEILPALPGDLAAPVLVVQHMPPIFTARLAERLDGRCALRVAEAVDGTRLEPGRIWIAPGGQHLSVAAAPGGAELRLHQGPPRHSCRPSVDELLLSVASVFGAGSLAVLLTGMGQDGEAGCRLIREVRGQIVVQDQATSVVWGMPGRVALAGIADAVLPVGEIAGEIARRVRARRPGSRAA